MNPELNEMLNGVLVMSILILLAYGSALWKVRN